MNKKIRICIVIFAFVFFLSGCGSSGNAGVIAQSKNIGIDLGGMLSQADGNTNKVIFDFNSEADMLADMKKATENSRFELYYNVDTMAVAVVDKSTGKILTTNPYSAAQDDNYSGSVASVLNSQLVLTYLENDIDLVDLYSADDCADLGQYKIKLHENGISFDMSIGLEKESNYIPKIISPERYGEICSKLSDDEIDIFKIYYTLYTADQFESVGVKEIYPDIKAQELYCCVSELSERDQRKLNVVFEAAQYGKEEYAADMKDFGVTDAIETYPNFKLSLCYALTENGLSVSIPAESVEYNEEYPLLRISLLPYFAAETPFAESDGYLFIPDGSGAIINLNNDDVAHRSIITGTVYGTNASKLPQKTVAETTQQYYLPVFGTVKDNNTAVFGIISSGDGNAEITARLGKPNGNYYATNAEFVTADYEKYTKISVVENRWSDEQLYLYDKNSLKDDMTVDFYILSDDKADYSSFASIYNKYLFGDKAKTDMNSTIHIETLGTALTNETKLIFQVEDETVFTHYEQNIKILDELSSDGRTGYSLLLRGWQKNGLDASVSGKLQFSSASGGKKGLADIRDYCTQNDIPFALQNNLSYVKFDRGFDGFSLKNDTARTLELLYAETVEAGANATSVKNSSYVVSANSYSKYVSGIYKDGARLGLEKNLSLGEIGAALNTDYSKNRLINRSQTMKLVVDALQKTKNNSFSFEGANAYVLPYTSAVNDILYENSGFAGESAVVPFLQLVLGDKVACRSAAINLQENTRDLLLGCIESGTVPTYVLAYQNISKLKVTDYTKYYAVDFEILKTSVKEAYDYVNAAVVAKGDSGIVAHHILSNGVTYTEYGNGNGVYVNRTDNDYMIGDLTVNAMDYAVKE